MTASLGAHDRQYGANAVQRAVKIDFEGIFPFLIRGEVERFGQAPASVVKQKVDLPGAEFRRLFYQVEHTRLLGNIRADAEHFPRIGRFQSLAFGFQLVFVHVRHHHGTGAKGQHLFAEAEADA